MKTAAQVEEEFRRDLAAFLAERGAEITIGDDGHPYGMHIGTATVCIGGKYENGETVAEFAEFRL